MSEEEVRKIKDTMEWVELVKKAIKLGLSKEEVRNFIRVHGGDSN
jgi:hypothetical protein